MSSGSLDARRAYGFDAMLPTKSWSLAAFFRFDSPRAICRAPLTREPSLFLASAEPSALRSSQPQFARCHGRSDISRPIHGLAGSLQRGRQGRAVYQPVRSESRSPPTSWPQNSQPYFLHGKVRCNARNNIISMGSSSRHAALVGIPSLI